MRFGKLEAIGNSSQRRLIRTEVPVQQRNLTDGQKLSIPKGAIGYCYSARPNTLFVGFQEDFRQPREVSPSSFEITIPFGLDQVKLGKLSIQE